LEARPDEVGMLSKAFGRMIAYLQEMAGMAKRIADNDLTIAAMPLSSKDILGSAFADMVANLKKMNREIQDSVNILATSAGEILSSTTEVASSVTETAASVNETTTTVEEVKQTAQVSTQKAKQVSEAAQRAVQVSQTGGKAVDDTIEKMNQIRLQMESIAGSIVRLSEQGQAIGEIIGAVNDLAEQSNLLAVNASIEAAKAGEHGKGFTVVAQEVRSLAEQSKQATAQVRAILNDIQKATSAAVLATEQGSKTVEEGVKQSGQAGEAIKALAGNIAEAAQAATQIAASSQQQLVGMEQVISAMNSVKLASEQNVTGTKQTEAAAHALNELGQKLKLLMAQYKL
ncbi:MAG: methyl-accepting chemotaxis protein, partial [Nitrospiraceae bacterium]|nr:methyl-accepting chemotaxis protein [Nitrospiraceae bacterium]